MPGTEDQVKTSETTTKTTTQDKTVHGTGTNETTLTGQKVTSTQGLTKE